MLEEDEEYFDEEESVCDGCGHHLCVCGCVCGAFQPGKIKMIVVADCCCGKG